MDNRPAHPLMWLATGLGMVAVVAVVLVGGLLYGMRWLATQPTSITNPVYLLIGIIIIGVLLIGHDAVDAWGDAYKAKAAARELDAADIERAAALANIRKTHASAGKDERDGAPAMGPWDDPGTPWPPAENGGPREFGG